MMDAFNETGLFTSLDYLLTKRKEKERFNLLMVVIEPTQNCSLIKLEEYDFVGYELLDNI